MRARECWMRGGGREVWMGKEKGKGKCWMRDEILQPHNSIIKHTSNGLNKNQSTGAEMKGCADWESCSANHSPSA